MKHFMAAALVGSMLISAPVFIGCEKTTEEHKTVDKAPDGTTVTKDQKTVESNGPGGATTKQSTETTTK